jgi:hypothetical protein
MEGVKVEDRPSREQVEKWLAAKEPKTDAQDSAQAVVHGRTTTTTTGGCRRCLQ